MNDIKTFGARVVSHTTMSPKLPSISENEDKSANLGNDLNTFVFTKEIDAGAELVACYAGELDAAEALRIRYVEPFRSNDI